MSEDTDAADSPSALQSFLSSGYGRYLTFIVVILICGFSLVKGLEFRRWLWDYTAPIHFTSDIHRGFYWGHKAATEGYLNLYEQMAHESDDADLWLDYAPLRLAIMRHWGAVNAAKFPGATEWQPDYEFNKPVLQFNTAMELITCVGIFLLVRHWAGRGTQTAQLSFWRKWFKPDFLKRPEQDPTISTKIWIRGLVAALLFWFNPAILQSAHAWPTWDMWIIPFYIWAVFFASIDWWFCSGLVIAIGAMFKGQQFFVAPIFILWPLFIGRLGAASRWLGGLVFGIAIIASPWLVTYLPEGNLSLPRIIDAPAILWVGAVTAAALLVPWILHIATWWTCKHGNAASESDGGDHADEKMNIAIWGFSSPRFLWGCATTMVIAAGSFELLNLKAHTVADILALMAVLITRLGKIMTRPIAIGIHLLVCTVAVLLTWLLIASPWTGVSARIGAFYCLALAALFVAIAGIIPLRRFPHFAAGALGVALLLCVSWFHGSDAWAKVSFSYGTHHWQLMTMGYTSNLPGILKERFGFQDVHQILFTIAPQAFHFWPQHPIDFDFRMLFIAIYAVLLLLCAIGIALQARRNDARFLVAITAPWLMFFCFAPQIHERYLIFAAGVGMVTIGYNIGFALLSIFLSLVTTIMQFHVMLIAAPQGPQSFGADISPNFGNKLFNFVSATYPDIGWAVLLAAGVFLYITITPSPCLPQHEAVRNPDPPI